MIDPSFDINLKELKPIAYVCILACFIAIVGSSYLFLFIYYRSLFMELSDTKLFLLACSLTSPVFFLNLLADIVDFSTKREKKNIKATAPTAATEESSEVIGVILENAFITTAIIISPALIAFYWVGLSHCRYAGITLLLVLAITSFIRKITKKK